MSYIADIYNASLREGFIPALLKTAAVCPIPKTSPSKSIETDIRPISLTCQVAKLLEGFTLARINKPILSDLDKKQFAITGKSTEQALVYLLHTALESLDKGNCSVRFFLLTSVKVLTLSTMAYYFRNSVITTFTTA